VVGDVIQESTAGWGVRLAGLAGRRPSGRLLIAALATLLLAGCEVFGPEVTASPVPTPILSGVRGIVLIGPTCAGATRANPCTEPYEADLVFLDASDQVVARVRSGPDGRFEVPLAPGTYLIQPVSPSEDPFPFGQAVSVTVGEEEYTEVGIDFDTGMR
jgi:hypothetical protein